MHFRFLEPISYRIDKNNHICWVSDNWLEFAAQNDAEESCAPANILGRPLIEFIDDMSTAALYDTIIKHVRNSRRSISFPFRCDAPEVRRFLQFEVVPLSNGLIEFRSSLRWEEHRLEIPLLRPLIDRSDETILICSVCNKGKVKDQWYEIEVAIDMLKLEEMSKLPMLTHGYCQECFDEVMGLIKDSNSTDKASPPAT